MCCNSKWMKIITFFCLALLIASLSKLQFARAQLFKIDPMSTAIKLECIRTHYDICKPKMVSDLLNLQLLACHAVVHSKECKQLVKESPQLSSHIMRCSLKDYCEEKVKESMFSINGCAEGYWGGTVDMVKGIKSLFDSGVEKIKKNKKIYEDFARACEPSLKCRREVVQSHPVLGILDDQELLKKNINELVATTGYRKYLEKNPDTSPKTSVWDSTKAVMGAAEDWLTKQGYKLECLDQQSRSELMCYGLSQVLDPTMAGGLVVKSARLLNLLKAVDKINLNLADNYSFVKDRRIGSEVSHHSTAKRAEIKEQLLHSEYTTEAENIDWIRRTEKPRSKKQLHVEIENAKLKELNDTLIDKDLVTSMTNMHKQLVMEEMEALAKKYPDLKFYPYSDFKSVRFAIEGKIPKSLNADLAKSFDDAGTKFESWVNANKLIRESDGSSKEWFKMGVGTVADEASAAARFARTQSGHSGVTHFSSKEVQRGLKNMFSKSQKLGNEITAELANTGMVELTSNGKKILKTDVFEILRKAEHHDDVASGLKKRFGLAELPKETVAKLVEYSKSVDQFSPSLHIAKREVATLDAAEFGGFSVDFVGLGAQNLHGVAAALADADNLSSVLTKARQAEKNVTTNFSKMKNSIREVSEGTLGEKLKTICSGDDCVGLPVAPLLDGEKQILINKIANQQQGSRVRMSFIQPGIKNHEARTQIATHGETIEKYLRSRLEGEIDPKRLKGLLFAVDMQTTNIGSGNARLLTGHSDTLTLSTAEKKKISEAFTKALKDLNRNFSDMPGYSQ